MFQRSIYFALVVILLCPVAAFAQSDQNRVAPGQAAETLRTALVQAQLALTSEPTTAAEQLTEAVTTYGATWVQPLRQSAPAVDQQIQAALQAAQAAVQAGDATALAVARAQVWTSLLNGAQQVVATAVQAGDVTTAQQWLAVREFRHATRFSRPNADATLALAALRTGTMSVEDTLTAINADLFDTYQARLTEALHDLTTAEQQGFAMRRAEYAALAQGYFALLAPAYSSQRGEAAVTTASAAFAKLTEASQSGQPIAAALTQVNSSLEGVPL